MKTIYLYSNFYNTALERNVERLQGIINIFNDKTKHTIEYKDEIKQYELTISDTDFNNNQMYWADRIEVKG